MAKRIITFDYLRTLDRDTLCKLVLQLHKQFDEIHARTKKLNLEIWRYRDKLAAIERQATSKPKRKKK